MRGGLDGIDGMDVYETRQRGEGVRGITEDRCVSDSVASIRRERLRTHSIHPAHRSLWLHRSLSTL